MEPGWRLYLLRQRSRPRAVGAGADRGQRVSSRFSSSPRSRSTRRARSDRPEAGVRLESRRRAEIVVRTSARAPSSASRATRGALYAYWQSARPGTAGPATRDLVDGLARQPERLRLVGLAGQNAARRRLRPLKASGQADCEPEHVQYPSSTAARSPPCSIRVRRSSAAAVRGLRPRRAGGPVPADVPAVVQYLRSAGFAVLAPNVRGSSGYGRTYVHLDDVRKRMDSVADLAHAVYWLRDTVVPTRTASPCTAAATAASWSWPR